MATEKEIKMLKFDGVGDYVNCGDNINLANADFTVEFWAKREKINKNSYIVNQEGSGSTNQLLHIGFRSNNCFTFAFYGNDLNTPASYTDSDWHQWTCVYDSNSKKRKIYRDGQEIAVDTSANHYAGKGLFVIGRSLGTNYFNGVIAEVRIWNCARAPEQIKADMNRFLTGRESGLVRYWRLNEGTGKIAKDLTGTSDGAITQCSWIDAIPPFTPETEKAIQFNGEGDCVKAVAFSGFPSDAITVEMWLRSSDKTKQGTPFSYAVTGDDNAFLIFNYNNLSISVNEENNPSNMSLADISLTDGQWHHMAVSWNGIDGDCILHVDGEKKFSAIQAKGKSIPDKGTVVLGQEQDIVGGGFDVTQAFKGEMCDVRIWNVVRTTEEIQHDMYFRLSGKEPGLVTYWQMNEMTGTTLRDITTVNTNDGAFIGCSLIDSDLYLKSDPIQQMLDLRLEWESLLEQVKNLNTEKNALVLLNPAGKNVPNLISTHNNTITNKDAAITGLNADIVRINNEKTDAVNIRDKEIDNIKKINRMVINISGFILSINDQSVTKMKENSVDSTVADKIKNVQGNTYDELITAIKAKLTEAEYNDNETKILDSVSIETPMVTLENLIENSNDQIKSAKQTLEEKQSSHRLENVTMEVKMVPGPGGTSMTFPTIEQLGSVSGDLSVINLDFAPQETSITDVQETTPTPDLIGYTEIMAIRRLEAANLIVEINYKAVKSSEEENRVVFHHPPAGELVLPMSVVNIAIGKLIKTT